MGAWWGLLVSAALLAPGAARAEDLADRRLAEPGAFGRFTDSSRARAEAAAVPVGGAFAASRAPHAASLTPSPLSGARVPAVLPVPAPTPAGTTERVRAVSPAKRTRSRLPGPSLTGLALVASGGLFLLALRPERREYPRPSPENWTPPPTWKREWPRADGPVPLPPLRLPEPPLALKLPWWAITNAEREAIARWDSSPEKEFDEIPLDRWLDARRSELSGVDVARLKEKLRRDA
jgi:hypothetical protein